MIPPLTTVDQALREQGWTAAAFAARIVRGEQVPPEIVLPPRLVLRTSCGCLPRAVVELGGLSTLPGRAVATTDTIVDRCLVRLAERGLILPGRTPRNLLASLLTYTDTDDFLRAYYEALVEEISHGEDVANWHAVLVTLQDELAERAQSADEVADLWSRFQKARVLLAEMVKVQQGRRWTDLVGQLESLRSVMEKDLLCSWLRYRTPSSAGCTVKVISLSREGKYGRKQAAETKSQLRTQRHYASRAAVPPG